MFCDTCLSSPAQQLTTVIWSCGNTQIQLRFESARPGCLQHPKCQHVASARLQLQTVHVLLVLRWRLLSMLFHLQFLSIWLTRSFSLSYDHWPTGCKGRIAFCRYKPDEVLISDHLAFASRFAAMAARKLSPDSKRVNVATIELHALLQVIDSFNLLQNNSKFSLKSCYL